MAGGLGVRQGGRRRDPESLRRKWEKYSPSHLYLARHFTDNTLGHSPKWSKHLLCARRLVGKGFFHRGIYYTWVVLSGSSQPEAGVPNTHLKKQIGNGVCAVKGTEPRTKSAGRPVVRLNAHVTWAVAVPVPNVRTCQRPHSSPGPQPRPPSLGDNRLGLNTL